MDSPIIKRKKGSWLTFIIFIIGIILIWGSLLFPVLSIPIFIGFCVYFLIRLRILALVLFVVFSPVGIFFLLGIHDYIKGTASPRFKGLPRMESFNPDPTFRYIKSNCGCVIYGYEWMSIPPYNASVLVMHHLFGPMHTSYQGPYPTKQQMLEALNKAVPIDIKELTNDTVYINGRAVMLDKGVGKGLTKWLSISLAIDRQDVNELVRFIENVGPITACFWQDNCLIVRIPAEMNYLEKSPNDSARIAVIDCETGRPFAYYYTGKCNVTSFPPVEWRKN